MNTYILSSLNAVVVDWLLENMPSLGLLAVIIWAGWKYFSWLNEKFNKIEFRFVTIENKLDNHEVRIINVETTLKEVVVSQNKIENRLAVVEVKIDELSKRMEDGFSSQSKRIDDLSKRMEDGFASQSKRIDELSRRMEEGFARQSERMDKGFAMQHEMNMKILSILEGHQKPPAIMVINPDN